MATNYERAKELVGESQDHWLLAPFIEEDRVAAFEKARQAVALIEKDASADGSLSSEEGLVYVAALAFSNEDGYLPELVKDRLKPCVSGVYRIISEATLDDEGKDEWAMSLLGVVETTLGRYVDRFSHAEPEYTKAEHRISPTSYFNGLIALMNLLQELVALCGSARGAGSEDIVLAARKDLVKACSLMLEGDGTTYTLAPNYPASSKEKMMGQKAFKADDATIEKIKTVKQRAQNAIAKVEPSYCSEQEKGGCYVATCVYGSYDCPEVWVLRRFRDQYLEKSVIGHSLVRIYYAVSPSVVKRFGTCALFRNPVRQTLDVFVRSLRNKGYAATPYSDAAQNSKRSRHGK